MQPPTVHCPSHIYTLVVTLNESVSYQLLFLQTESTMVANVTRDNLQENALATLFQSPSQKFPQ